MQDSTTAHVSRAAALERHGNFLEVARTLARAGFAEYRDAVLIHRKGTVLYASPAACRLLELDGDALVGSPVAGLVHPSDRARVELTLARAARSSEMHATTSARLATGGRSMSMELTALASRDPAQELEILYVRPRCSGSSPNGEDEPYMATRESLAVGRQARRTSVLICDDEARLGALTAGLLAEYGFNSITVGSGEDAIVALSKAEPAIDVVLLDVNLAHGKPARDVLSTIEARGDRVRVVLTSGLAEEDVDPALIGHPSVAGYVAKPYGVDELVQTIKRALVFQKS